MGKVRGDGCGSGGGKESNDNEKVNEYKKQTLLNLLDKI